MFRLALIGSMAMLIGCEASQSSQEVSLPPPKLESVQPADSNGSNHQRLADQAVANATAGIRRPDVPSRLPKNTTPTMQTEPPQTNWASPERARLEAELAQSNARVEAAKELVSQRQSEQKHAAVEEEIARIEGKGGAELAHLGFEQTRAMERTREAMELEMAELQLRADLQEKLAALE